MKYIRTKDGVFENKPLERKWGRKGRGGYTIEWKDSDIVNKADTIEELCDEFVFGDVIISLEEAKRDCKIGNVYGAIWTKWGLKYVAIMNDKGELELL